MAWYQKDTKSFQCIKGNTRLCVFKTGYKDIKTSDMSVNRYNLLHITNNYIVDNEKANDVCSSNVFTIRLTSHEHHGFMNHRQPHYLFNRLLRLTSKKTPNHKISAGHPPPPPPPPHTHTHTHTHTTHTHTHTHRAVMQKRFPSHVAIMIMFRHATRSVAVLFVTLSVVKSTGYLSVCLRNVQPYITREQLPRPTVHQGRPLCWKCTCITEFSLQD